MVSPIDQALRQLEATEANLVKLERLWDEIEQIIDRKTAGGSAQDRYQIHEDLCRRFRRILTGLPAINGWSPSGSLMGLGEVELNRFEAGQVDEPDIYVSTEEQIHRPGEDLRTYRFEFNVLRRRVVREAVGRLLREADGCLERMAASTESTGDRTSDTVSSPDWGELKGRVSQIDALLGSSVDRPPRWGDLQRHLAFAQHGDLHDILEHDWPAVRPALERALHGDDDPLPVEVEDLSDLAASEPTGTAATRLNWERLSAEDFERLVFDLVRDAPGYENPQWLTRTDAPDRGRDVSVEHSEADSLGGSRRTRVILACKHWLARSVSPADVSLLRDQMTLHEPPRVDTLIIVTSGRFTGDAVALIEKHNQEDHALRIGMWAETHLEHLLAERPHLVAEFALR